jgi:hypothetical protein
MSALESLIASTGEAPLHPALDYMLPSPSTAVTDRRQHCRAYPTSASSLSINGTKTLRFRLGTDFIDPNSLRLQYTITNLDAGKLLRPVSGPWCRWQQCYLRSGGVELDNIPFFGRFFQQYSWNHLTREEQFGSLGCEGFHTSTAVGETNWKPAVGQIATGSFTCMHRLPLSLFSAGKLLPCMYAGLELEISMVNDLNDFCLPASAGGNTGTQNFVVSDAQLIYDAVQLDESVLSSFYDSLLKNRVLSIPIMNAYQVVHTLPAGSTTYSFSSVRAFSRLAQV